ncbi:unnamed protein product [Vitrella brassicaformis CCMP3155]|uniref:ISP1 C-terminal domain-containing protein n=1 Tax=Vitrella brassicaformis (strain CCMP3155) TaxID=1169540 RepID=A0A0G4GJG9_VITBC|nr:unnamed protein product [Vitrella brassicaformis CCMP3155]|mmetsp:Transcript_31227/g.77340  ORF Transcript_31227/g.77340 Transcript_31227/m.77340 type:complete len:245 (-) Transcript_31227:740-1474(-)|eukprot:CEM30069.1 unnamed protein product [Vitrella brassicaformis CCMP3155]
MSGPSALSTLFCGCCATGATDTAGQVNVGPHTSNQVLGLQDIPELKPTTDAQQGPESAVPKSDSPPPWESHKVAEGEAAGGVSPAPGRAESRVAKMTAEEKEKEKARLQKLVKEFAKDAVKGIDLQCVNYETGEMIKVKFSMDGYLTSFTVTPVDKTDPIALPPSLAKVDMKFISAVFKGGEILRKCPDFYARDDVNDIVGMEVDPEKKQLFFHFEESYLRDKFYTCLKILRLSVEVSKTKGGE